MSIAPVPESVPTTARGAALRARRGRRARLGGWGEDVAASHLESGGWTILARNWAAPPGEADIIARDPGGTNVIVEVRTRSTDSYGSPVESITEAKLRRLEKLAMAWLGGPGRGCRSVRIDVIGVLGRPGEPPRILHICGVQR